MTSAPLATVVVLNWNGAGHLGACLDALARLDYPNTRLLAVDNGSTDGSLELARARGVAVLENGANLGFARGVNAGIRRALAEGAEYVALANPDLVVEPGWLAALVACAAESGAGIVGGLVVFLDDPEKVNSTGLVFDRWGRARDRDFGARRSQLATPAGECEGVTGGSMLLTREAVERAGLFDPGFFAYYEDADLCLRARRRGVKVAWTPRAVARHAFAGSFGEGSARRRYLLGRNQMRFAGRHLPAPRAALLLPLTALYRAAVKAPMDLLLGRPALGAAELLAAATGLAAGALALAARLAGLSARVPPGAEP